VLQAEHGEAALGVVRGFLGVLALAIVDMNMPVMTGSEFAREFRPMRPSVPVLFITGRQPMVSGRPRAAQAVRSGRAARDGGAGPG
jgi:CheY-like chemotaxis protein